MVVGCGPPPSQPAVDADPRCEEVWRPLAPDEVSPWGTSVALTRVRFGGAYPVLAVEDGSSAIVRLGWPAGLESLVFAAPQEELEDPPPGWCQDGIELPVRLTLEIDGTLHVGSGRLRAVGAVPELLAATTIDVGPAVWDLPEGGERWVVWATFDSADGTVRARIEIRGQSAEGDVFPPTAVFLTEG
jgi:hypothetical protein